MTAILDVVGISNADIRDFVVSSMSIYAPIAFREAMNTKVTPTASVSVLREDLKPDREEDTAAKKLPTRGLEALGQAWVISNTSLIVPILPFCLLLRSAHTEPRA
jgi:hypothetical protein